jgi:hypothetical protein
MVKRMPRITHILNTLLFPIEDIPHNKYHHVFLLDHLLLYNKYVLNVHYFPITHAKIKQPMAMLTAVFFLRTVKYIRKFGINLGRLGPTQKLAI